MQMWATLKELQKSTLPLSTRRFTRSKSREDRTFPIVSSCNRVISLDVLFGRRSKVRGRIKGRRSVINTDLILCSSDKEQLNLIMWLLLFNLNEERRNILYTR